MAFVPKSRRAKFDLTLRILDLNNVPLVSGSSFIKWHLPSSTSAEHRGRTQKCPIKDHRVLYDYTKQLPVRLTVGKDGMLQECVVDFEVCQEYSVSGRGERIVLGRVKLNLAEYVEVGEVVSPGAGPQGAGGSGGEGEGVVRRYLMQDSKINSTVKLGITMKHVEGARDYIAPPLRTAPVFGGIAGIISSAEPATTAAHINADAGHLDPADGPIPSLSVNSREAGEMQDMYRRTLAAFWASQPGELKADECIEDIFAGGDGWGKHGPPPSLKDLTTPHGEGSGHSTPRTDEDGRREHGRKVSETPSLRSGGAFFSTKGGRHGEEERHGGGVGHARQGSYHAYGKKHKATRKAPGELDEFELREDLRSWRVGETAWT